LTKVWVTPAAFWAQTGAMTEGHFPLQRGVLASTDLERTAKVEATVKVIKVENFIFFFGGGGLKGEVGRGVRWKVEELLVG
jgi:hypothetical protein